MMSNIKKYVREFSAVTVTSGCGCKTFTRLDRKGVYRWINVSPNGKLDDPSCKIEAEDLLEELEDEAFWLCTARAEKQKGIEMW